MNIGNTIKYNNAVPIAVSILLLVSGTVVAGNPEVRESITDSFYQVEETVVSIDNTYIAEKDLDEYTPTVRILAVAEDADNYFVSYLFTTIDLVEYVWQDVEQEKIMIVAKNQLGGRDLGLYVTKQLREVIDRELTRLKSTQEFEKRDITEKTVATAYKGLVGKFLDDTTETLPGYRPVVPQPVRGPIEPAKPKPDPRKRKVQQTPPLSPEEILDEIAEEQEEVSDEAIEESEESNEVEKSEEVSNEVAEENKNTPEVQVLGDNPARVLVGETYIDLGAAATSHTNEELTYEIFFEGVLVETVEIDTSIAREYAVIYIARDTTGNEGSAERKVIVYDEEVPAGGGGGGGGGASSVPEPELEPESPTPSESEVSEVEPGEGEPTPEPEPTPELEPEPTPEPISEPEPSVPPVPSEPVVSGVEPSEGSEPVVSGVEPSEGEPAPTPAPEPEPTPEPEPAPTPEPEPTPEPSPAP